VSRKMPLEVERKRHYFIAGGDFVRKRYSGDIGVVYPAPEYSTKLPERGRVELRSFCVSTYKHWL